MTAAALSAVAPTASSSAVPPTAAPAAAGVLIVDDSAVARAVIGRVIDASDRYFVAGVAPDVPGALAFLARARVDYVLLDINLPGVDGVTALPDLIAAGGKAKVLVVSSAAAAGAATTVQALAFGAADTMEKPETGSLSARWGAALIERLDRLSDPTPRGVPAAIRPAAIPVPATGAYDMVAIGASTGGIHALSQLLRELPATFRLPVLVTQHLPATFMPYFAAQLALLAGRPCDVATDRLRVRPGRVIVAPGDAHIRCVPAGEGAAIRLNHDKVASGCTPSVDPMLASVAATFGDRALGVVLSGMGRDGVDGARRLHEAGGTVVVQDQASSVVWGMPGAVAQAGLAAAMLPPAAIGRLIAERRRP